jgi:propanol-preferring alcohol dehydrogenase
MVSDDRIPIFKTWADSQLPEGNDFKVEVQMVDVPEPSKHFDRCRSANDFADSTTEDGELLVRLNCTGLCMSDVHFMMNDWALPPMSFFGVRCAGHEGAGVVVKKGAKVGDEWKVGDRVGVKPLADTCHNCEECWNGREWKEASCYRSPGLTSNIRRELLCKGHLHRTDVYGNVPTVPYFSGDLHLSYP